MKTIQSLLLLLLVTLHIQLLAQTPANVQKLKRADCFFGVHFDLHAGEEIEDAGKTLTYAMIDTFLARVRPDFIQIDCKGHPGISSYPTEVGFHVKGFEKDPLRLFREVTQKNNVALFMHFSGVWDGKVATEHPDWAVIKANGERSTQKVSFFSPYLDTYMIPQLKELSSRYKVDGAWIDGECWAVEPDWGEASLKRFTQETGITEIPRKPSDRYYPEFVEYTRELFREHLGKYVDAIHRFDPGFQITSNWSYSSMMPEPVTTGVDYLSGDVTPQNGVYRSAFEARCLAPQGKPWDLMAWGFSWDGGKMPMSIKSALQLKQEAAGIIAMGGGVQFYFQQNRDLSIKPWIAGMLADIGNFCRERQPYCHKAVHVPQIALLYPTAAYRKNASVPFSGSSSKLQGALYALLDGQQAVEIRMEHHLTGRMKYYPLIIVPECDYLSKDFKEDLTTYVKNGGNLLLIGTSTAQIFKEELGILTSEKQPEQAGFIAVNGKIGSVKSEILDVTLHKESQPLSFFYQGSDFRNPSRQVAASVSQLGKGRMAAIYFNAGSCYAEYKTFIIRDFINEIADRLFPDKMVQVRGSKLVHVTVNTLNDRLYVNLINAGGEHNGKNTIGYDVLPELRDIEVTIRTGSKPTGIFLQPGGKSLDFSYSDGRTVLTVPELPLHAVLEIIK